MQKQVLHFFYTVLHGFYPPIMDAIIALSPVRIARIFSLFKLKCMNAPASKINNSIKKFKFLFFSLAGLFCSLHLSAQQEDFSNCSAAFLNEKMIVNEYTTEGKCIVPATATGKLTLHPVTLLENNTPVAGKKIRFKVAIRSGGSKTLMLFSEKTYQEIDIQTVLKECKKGDHIVLLTLERTWAVPHSEILVD